MALALASAMLPITATATSAAPANDLVPDIRMEPLYGLYVQETKKHKLHLRFGTLVDSIGDGPLIIRGNKRVKKKLTRVVQRVRRDDGSYRDILQPNATIFYEDRGIHVHWHLRDFIQARVTPLIQTDPPTERHGSKLGFCLIDTTQMPAEQRPPNWAPKTFNDCGTTKSTKVRMGISVGWGDVYEPYYTLQWVDVTGLPSGDYRLCSFVNPQNLWLEKTTDNNYQYVDFTFNATDKSLAVIASGATAC
jgi:hypothetical protein